MSVKIYIKDKTDGKVREYGTNRHDSLILQKDGSLHYLNLQCYSGTGKGGDYEFCMKDGSLPTEEEDSILDIGGELTGVDCDFCLNLHTKVCSCCKRNPKREADFYEPDKDKIEKWQEEVFAAFDNIKDELEDLSDDKL